MRELQLIVTMDHRRVIGHNGSIPWHYREDFRHFRRTTTGHAVIMGRQTHLSIGKALDKRENIVVTGQPGALFSGCQTAPSLAEALQLAYQVDDAPFVIGGARLYQEALTLATTLHITRVPGDHEGDTFFPELPADTFHLADEKQAGELQFMVFRRTSPL